MFESVLFCSELCNGSGGSLAKPHVSLMIGSVKVTVNIILDFPITSKFHMGHWNPNINMQAARRLSCDMAAALIGLFYFFATAAQTVYGGVLALEGRNFHFVRIPDPLEAWICHFYGVGHPAYALCMAGSRNRLHVGRFRHVGCVHYDSLGTSDDPGTSSQG
jgi:hypothetical protein